MADTTVVRRNNSIPKSQRYTFYDFQRDFPTDEACLEKIREKFYPDGIFCKKCQRQTKHHKSASRPSYCCDFCGNHVHPMVGTIFEKSSTPLRTWFHAIYLMSATRCGISAKQIQRETGVTYKTAWRMFKQIRSLLDESNDEPLSGEVEVDESYFGGKEKNKHASKRLNAGRGPVGKTVVAGAVERKGRVRAIKVDGTESATLVPFVKAHVLESSMVFTDEHKSYGPLKSHGYAHKRVHHSAGVYVDGDAHTNTIEGFWSLVKRGIGGVYHAVGADYLQTYLNEYAFRYNHRDDQRPMFLTFLDRVSRDG